MGAIKDLVDLVTQLSNSVEDRKFAGELRQIQSMIGGIQSEHATMHEQRIDLMTKNADFKNDNASLRQQIATLQQEITALKHPTTTPNNKLSEEAETILLYLTKYDDASSSQIAHNISVSLTRTEYWIGVLSEQEFIDFSLIIGAETTYYLAQNGREYLVKNNLI